MLTNSIKAPLIEPEAKHINDMIDLYEAGQHFHHALYPGIFCPPCDHESVAHHFRNYMAPEPPLARLKRRQNPFALLFRPRTRFSIGWTEEGKLYGYILYTINQTNNVLNGDKHLEVSIEDVAVSTKMRRRGIAKNLIQGVYENTSTLGNCHIFAQVWDGNDASNALFKEAGFTAVSTQYHRMRTPQS